MELLIGDLQYFSHNTSLSGGNHILVKKRKENIDLLSREVDHLFKSVIEITESTENITAMEILKLITGQLVRRQMIIIL